MLYILLLNKVKVFIGASSGPCTYEQIGAASVEKKVEPGFGVIKNIATQYWEGLILVSQKVGRVQAHAVAALMHMMWIKWRSHFITILFELQ